MQKLLESRTPRLHQQHSYKLDPGTPPGCEVVWSINGQTVGVGAKVGGLEVKGIGAGGEMTVEVSDDTTNTTVTAKIFCPGAPPNVVGPMPVGSGEWPAPVGAGVGGGPVGVPLNPAAVVFPINKWSWWDRIAGACPGTWTIGGAQCQCNMVPTTGGIWPIYYTVSCTFTCPNFQVTVVKWTLSFGVVVDGPN